MPDVDRVVAVLIGVERPGPITHAGSTVRFRPLRGVRNDIDWYVRFFGRIVQPPTMLDIIEPSEPDHTTVAALQEILRSAYSGLRDGDLLVIVLCGHGFQVRDEDGDEPDRLDEVFAATDGPILDDFFNEVWTTGTDADASAVVIVDTCNSDTLGIMGFTTEPITVHHDGGIPRLSVSASEEWQEARETYNQPKPRGYLSQAIEDAWEYEPDARRSYAALFETAAQLVGGRATQTTRIRYYGPRGGEILLDEVPFGYRAPASGAVAGG